MIKKSIKRLFLYDLEHNSKSYKTGKGKRVIDLLFFYLLRLGGSVFPKDP
jgi:hypothetical protein